MALGESINPTAAGMETRPTSSGYVTFDLLRNPYSTPCPQQDGLSHPNPWGIIKLIQMSKTSSVHNADSAGQINLRFIAWLFIAGGIVITLLSCLKLYPYVHSRLIAPSTNEQSPATERHLLTLPVLATTSITPTEMSLTSSPPTPMPNMAADADAALLSPTRIIIPSIGVNAHVEAVSWHVREVEGKREIIWEVPERYAAGWHKNSASPGEQSNIVINGHNTTHGEIFRGLYKLKSGDNIVLHAGDLAHTYTVSETMVLNESTQSIATRDKHARYVMPTSNERLTLITCHPYGSLRNRLIVIAQPTQTDKITARSFRNFRPLWKLWNIK